jgi:hypothetical protein
MVPRKALGIGVVPAASSSSYHEVVNLDTG